MNIPDWESISNPEGLTTKDLSAEELAMSIHQRCLNMQANIDKWNELKMVGDNEAE